MAFTTIRCYWTGDTVTDFTIRVFALLMLVGAPLHAQEVQVFSGGKPYAISEEINAAFAPARDERKARRPLDERHDAAAIAAAHAAAFLHCGLDESKYPPDKAAGPEGINYFSK